MIHIASTRYLNENGVEIEETFPDPTESWISHWRYDRRFHGSHHSVVLYRLTKPLRNRSSRAWTREYEARRVAEQQAIVDLIEATTTSTETLIG